MIENDYQICGGIHEKFTGTKGIEFIPSDKVKYPDDFPKVGAEISVTGVFYTYKEGDSTFAALKDAKFKVV